MIALGIDDFLLVLVGGMMALVMLAWGWQLWRDYFHQWNVSEDSLCRCPGCGLIFVVKRVESVTRCPSCEALTRIRTKKVHNKMTY
jgi:hypothetical protein